MAELFGCRLWLIVRIQMAAALEPFLIFLGCTDDFLNLIFILRASWCFEVKLLHRHAVLLQGSSIFSISWLDAFHLLRVYVAAGV